MASSFVENPIQISASYTVDQCQISHTSNKGISSGAVVQDVLQISVPKNFVNVTGKYLCWSLFLVNLQALDLQLY